MLLISYLLPKQHTEIIIPCNGEAMTCGVHHKQVKFKRKNGLVVATLTLPVPVILHLPWTTSDPNTANEIKLRPFN